MSDGDTRQRRRRLVGCVGSSSSAACPTPTSTTWHDDSGVFTDALHRAADEDVELEDVEMCCSPSDTQHRSVLDFQGARTRFPQPLMNTTPGARDPSLGVGGMIPGDSDFERTMEGDNPMSLLFEDSGSFCTPIPEDIEDEEEEEEDMDVERVAFFQLSSPSHSDSGQFFGSSSLSPGSSLPVDIPSTDGKGATSGAASVTKGAALCTSSSGTGVATTPSSPPSHATNSSMSLSPVIDSVLRKNLKSRLSGEFEERSLQASARIIKRNLSNSDFRGLTASSDVTGQSLSSEGPAGAIPRPRTVSDGMAVDADAASRAQCDGGPGHGRSRSQSAPPLEAALIIRSRDVGGKLRDFGDQLYKDYDKKQGPARSPRGQQTTLRRQVLSCPTQHSLVQQRIQRRH